MQNYKFYIDERDNELKQHLNLSENAWMVINEDIKNFYESEEKESFSGFLNRIFKNFYQQADASINLRYMEKGDELEKLYSSEEFSSLDKKTIKMFIDKYAKVYENELKEKALSYPSGHGEKFRIDKESLKILRDVDEAIYYGDADGNNASIGKYLKAIFEEYSLKPSYQREQIFFSNTLAEINKSIENEKKLKISLLAKVSTDGKKHYTRKFYVSPYKLVQDKNMLYNYLIGYAEEIKEFETTDEQGRKVRTSSIEKKCTSSFRLSRIEKADMMSSMGAHISKDNSKILEQELKEKTAMFMSSGSMNIKVIFTDKGLESFRRQLYMRPQIYEIDKTDKHIYTFRCTDVQAIDYFFKMGWDAKIVEPISLRNKMIKRYDSALKTYQGLTKDEIIGNSKSSEVKNG